MATQAASAGAEIEAAALVPAPPEEVFEFLSDLANHWRLTDRFVKVVELTGRPATGGVVRLYGPLGIRRTVVTQVKVAREPRLMIGTAELGEETRVRVSWTLAGRLGQTRVRLAAEVERAGALDRLLLRVGGRIWLRRAFARTLERLAERFELGPSADASVGPRLDDDPARASLE